MNLRKNYKFFLYCTSFIFIFIYINSIVYFNPSKSMKKGYYLKVFYTSLNIGDNVLICIKDEIQQKTMHDFGLPYIKNQCKQNFPYLLKRIFAKENDVIQVSKMGIWINGKLISNTLILNNYRNHKLYSLLHFGFYKLKKSEFLVLGITSHSYDSRYFGVIKKSQIYGKVILL